MRDGVILSPVSKLRKPYLVNDGLSYTAAAGRAPY